MRVERLNVPGVHGVHLDSPEGEVDPALQGAHSDAELDLRLGLAVPAAHAVHGARPVADQEPGLQTEMQADLDVDWGGEDKSLSHGKQHCSFVHPELGLYVPSGQDTHVEAY